MLVDTPSVSLYFVGKMLGHPTVHKRFLDDADEAIMIGVMRNFRHTVLQVIAANPDDDSG